MDSRMDDYELIQRRHAVFDYLQQACDEVNQALELCDQEEVFVKIGVDEDGLKCFMYDK